MGHHESRRLSKEATTGREVVMSKLAHSTGRKACGTGWRVPQVFPFLEGRNRSERQNDDDVFMRLVRGLSFHDIIN